MNPRSILALLVSPLLIPGTFLTGALIAGMSYGELSMSMVFYVPAGYVVAIVFGIPMVLVFRLLRCRNPLFYIFGGLGVGFLTSVLARRFFGHWSDEWSYYVMWLTSSTLASLVAWLSLHGLRHFPVDAVQHAA